MADTVAAAPLAQTESNTARKKRVKAEQAAKATSTEVAPSTSSEPAEDKAPHPNGDHPSDSAYIKELQKFVDERISNETAFDD